MAGGGLPREWLRPLRPDGNLNDPNDALGCHRGDFEHMNVVNAQPGFSYYYAKNSPGAITSLMRRGYELVTSDHPERLGDVYNPNHGSNPTGLQAFGELVLMRIPTERAARERQKEAEQIKSQLSGATKEFLDESDVDTLGRPIRYQNPGHGVQFE